jgi:hypothetical protein
MGGLSLETRASLLKGGGRGPAVVPGDAEKSLLYRFVAHRDTPSMPPGETLSAAEVAALKAWINAGANRTGEKPNEVNGGKATASKPVVPPSFWAAHPVRHPTVPVVKNKQWVQTPIDAYILKKLEANGLAPSPRADSRTLIRRAYFDVIGLPPTPEEIEAFQKDTAPNAFEKVVDRLLSMPQYGERWGRHWLDLVRYAETNGYERDGTKANSWKYRDYVIDSFNKDKPFDRFILENLAGDELPHPTNETRIATGYYRLGLWDDEPGDHLLDRYDQLDDTVKTTSNVLMGLTVNCARCHDHKFDPITQVDYTRMLAFFTSSKLGTEVYPNGQHKQSDDQIALAEPDEIAQFNKANAEADARIQAAQKSVDEQKEAIKQRIMADRKGKLSDAERAALDAPDDKRTPEQKTLAEKASKSITPSDEEIVKEATPEEAQKRATLEEALNKAKVSKPAPLPTTLGNTDVGPEPVKTFRFRRGNPRDPMEEAQPGFPSVFAAVYAPPLQPAPSGYHTTNRRLQLAEWLASPKNPLTARVWVNRIWQHHFGYGIVRTPNDFGTMGDKPTHPELLDWLASDFMAHGWTLKRLHKMILLSSAWQQASGWRNDAGKKDEENRLLWRQNYRRLEAEPIRDSILAVSGKLNLQMGGPSVYPKLPVSDLIGEVYAGNAWGKSDEAQADRRTVYVFVKRSLQVPMLEAFDVADPNAVCPVRNNTTVAPQALSLMNNEFVLEQARYLAERLKKECGTSLPKRVDRAFRLTLGRSPTSAELSKSLAFLNRQRSVVSKSSSPTTSSADSALADFCQALFNLNEFLYVD